MASKMRPLAVVNRSIEGIGYELAKQCAESGFDLLIGADEPEINAAADRLRASAPGRRRRGGPCHEPAGVDKLYDASRSTGSTLCWRMPDAGLGRAFLDQELAAVRRVIDTNVTGTVYLVHKVGRDMRPARRFAS